MPASRAVLLVDDDPDIRDSVGECLRDEGYEVHTAGNGQEALDRLSYGLRPSVILLDLMMPVLNGFEVLQALRDRPDWQGIPVVIVSANRGYEAEDMRGVFDILRKPVPLEQMLDAIERALAAGTLAS
ncbi:MAG TPA: response regulator [Myxococcales bacterium]|nr:response regulator [Myxococcales bacterium]